MPYGKIMENNKSKSAQQCREWLGKEGRKMLWLSEQVPVNNSHLSRWLNGKSTPSMVYRHRIAEITGGAVSVEGWE